MLEYYSPRQAANELGCTVKDIREMCRNGVLDHTRVKPNGGYLIKKDQPAFKQKAKVFYKYISDEDHFNIIIEKALNVKSNLEFSCANFKGLRVIRNERKEEFIDSLAKLAQKGIEVRILLSSPTTIIKQQLEDLQALYAPDFLFSICPRIHMKVIIFDKKEAYIGSANITPAAMGHPETRMSKENNFEAGVLTNDPDIVNQVIDHFNYAWGPDCCSSCSKNCVYN